MLITIANDSLAIMWPQAHLGEMESNSTFSREGGMDSALSGHSPDLRSTLLLESQGINC